MINQVDNSVNESSRRVKPLTIPNKNLASYVADELRSAIIAGTFKTGEKLAQDTIAEQLGLSKIPIREALVQLESEGLVQIIRHKGAIVTGLTGDEALELFEIRIQLEPLAIVDACKHIDEEGIRQLRLILDSMDGLTNNRAEWLELNRLFHQTVYSYSRRKHLNKILEIRANIDRFLQLYIRVADDMTEPSIRHRKILTALEARNSIKAREEVITHLEETKLVLINALEKNLKE